MYQKQQSKPETRNTSHKPHPTNHNRTNKTNRQYVPKTLVDKRKKKRWQKIVWKRMDEMETQSAWSLVRILEWALPAVCTPPAISVLRSNSAGQPLCVGRKETSEMRKMGEVGLGPGTEFRVRAAVLGRRKSKWKKTTNPVNKKPKKNDNSNNVMENSK